MSRRLRAMQKAKTAKQKKIAIVGAVLLLGILAFSVPQTLKLLNKSNAAAAPPPAATTAPPPAAPAPGAPATPGAPSAPAGELVSVDLAPVPGDGQLASFERFATKDPFAQQVVAVAPSAPAPEKKGEAKPAAKKEPAKPKPTKVDTPGTAENPEGPSKQPVVTPTSAVISVNGVSETVAPGADFPAELKIFTLVSLAPGKAEIAIAGGTLAGGAETVTLVKGEKLTLMNTADGTRYELILVSLA